MVHEIGKSNSVFNHFIREIRDVTIQNDRMRFRRNLERIGEIMAYELSKKFTYENTEVITPLGEASVSLMTKQPVICAILRAALPLHQGFLNYFDHADSAFVAAYRRHHKGGEFEIDVDYSSSPIIEGRELILVDPMLATGASIEMVYKRLLSRGVPSRVHIAAVIASEVGIKHIRSKLPENTEVWVGAVDYELTAQAYIVPGLGDAGDLAYGKKD
jgi:uracil phosphoribosyltransferase